MYNVIVTVKDVGFLIFDRPNKKKAFSKAAEIIKNGCETLVNDRGVVTIYPPCTIEKIKISRKE